MTSSYHEHTGTPCTSVYDASCPTPPGDVYCEQIDTDLFGCTHIIAAGLTGAPLEALAASLAASYRAASISRAAETEITDTTAVDANEAAQP